MAEPSSEAEVEALFDHLMNESTESAYLRLVSVKWPLPFEYRASSVVPGRGWIVRDGTDVVVFGYGPWLLSNAWHAAEALASEGVSVRLVNLPWLNRVESAWLKQTIGSCRSIVTLDNHYLHGGQGDMIAGAVASLSLSPAPRVARYGVAELPECGTNDEVLQYHGLDIESLTSRLRQAVPQVA